jgi:hypothetical protein
MQPQLGVTGRCRGLYKRVLRRAEKNRPNIAHHIASSLFRSLSIESEPIDNSHDFFPFDLYLPENE